MKRPASFFSQVFYAFGWEGPDPWGRVRRHARALRRPRIRRRPVREASTYRHASLAGRLDLVYLRKADSWIVTREGRFVYYGPLERRPFAR
jgi:hypothetical protein